MKKISVFLICSIVLAQCTVAQAAGLRFGMTGAVKEQAKEVDKKVTELKTASSGPRGITLLAKATNLATAPLRRAPGNKFIDPQKYRTALATCQLLKSETDANPYILFETPLSGARAVDLGSNASELCDNTNYPSAGTYTHMRVSILYLQQKTTMTGPGTITFRVYFSTLGSYAKGDIIVSLDDGTTWKWVNTGSLPWSMADIDAKPASWLTQVGGLNTLGLLGLGPTQINVTVLEPYTFTMPLATPLVVPANPAGKWTMTMSFDTDGNVGYSDDNGNDILDGGESFWCEPPKITVNFTK